MELIHSGETEEEEENGYQDPNRHPRSADP
jgi:hypothetical protein